jgi:SAM-dependent methyltransferase
MGEANIPQRDHPLGKPAAFHDRIVTRRVNLLCNINGFLGKQYDLVDIGCGNGATMFLLAPEVSQCVGLEINDTHQRAFEEYKHRHSIGNCKFRNVDIESSRPDRTFDRLISFEVIEHLRDEQSVRFYFDALKPGGLGAITVPNKWWIFETHGARLPVLPWNRVPFFSWLPRPLHEKYANARIYTRKRITKLLESAGFIVTGVSYVTAPLDILPDGWLKNLLLCSLFRRDTTKIPFLATAIFVAVRKPGSSVIPEND